MSGNRVIGKASRRSGHWLMLLRAALFGVAILGCAVGPVPRGWAQPAAAVSDPAIWIDFQRVQRAQSALLDQQFAKLGTQPRGDREIYVIALAGWSSQDVFLSELDGALTSIRKTLPVREERVVRLVNSARTVETIPVANIDNFEASVRAVGRAMNKQNDILLLLMTSHGTQNGIALKLGRATGELTAQQVATVLDREQVKNRVVIVSACYSGVFVKPLANDNTIVLTASDAENTSFGCGAKRAWTYFGDALFNQSLRPGIDLRSAFNKARLIIQGWEWVEKLRPSNPQGYFGAALTQKLDTASAAMTGQQR